jgi:hypothetical protein
MRSVLLDSRLGRLFAAALMIYAVGGLAFILFLGDTFISKYALHPLVIAIIVSAPGIGLAGIAVQHLRNARDLTSPALSTLAFIIFSFVAAGALFVAGIGWIAIASSLLPKQESTLELRVLSIGRKESRRDVCYRYLELQNGSSVERLCADKLPLNGQLRAGDRVKLLGSSSVLGFHIRNLQAPNEGG